jgi:hypothetical protein
MFGFAFCLLLSECGCMWGNGNVFRAFVEETGVALQDVKAFDYYQRPLPDELDNNW